MWFYYNYVYKFRLVSSPYIIYHNGKVLDNILKIFLINMDAGGIEPPTFTV